MNESEEIVQYQQQLLRYIKTKISNADDADDILAIVFEKFIKESNKPANPIAWLYLVTKNSIIDFYRVQRLTLPLPDEFYIEESNLDQFELLAVCVAPFLNELDEKYKQVIRLVDIDGNKQQQVALELGLSLSALKSRLLRARKQLKNKLVLCCPPIKNNRGETINFASPKKKCNQC